MANILISKGLTFVQNAIAFPHLHSTQKFCFYSLLPMHHSPATFYHAANADAQSLTRHVSPKLTTAKSAASHPFQGYSED